MVKLTLFVICALAFSADLYASPSSKNLEDFFGTKLAHKTKFTIDQKAEGTCKVSFLGAKAEKSIRVAQNEMIPSAHGAQLVEKYQGECSGELKAIEKLNDNQIRISFYSTYADCKDYSKGPLDVSGSINTAAACLVSAPFIKRHHFMCDVVLTREIGPDGPVLTIVDTIKYHNYDLSKIRERVSHAYQCVSASKASIAATLN